MTFYPIAAGVVAVALLFGQPAIAVAAPVALVAQADTGDETIWSLVKDTDDPSVLQKFLAQFPKSAHAAEAQEKLDALSESGDAIAAPAIAAPTETASLDWTRYVNQLYGYQVDIPPGFGISAALHGYGLKLTDSKATIYVLATDNGTQGFAEYMKSVHDYWASRAHIISETVNADNETIVTTTDGNADFSYSHSVAFCGGRIVVSAELIYPQENTAFYEPFLARMSKSLSAAEGGALCPK